MSQVSNLGQEIFDKPSQSGQDEGEEEGVQLPSGTASEEASKSLENLNLHADSSLEGIDETGQANEFIAESPAVLSRVASIKRDS